MNTIGKLEIHISSKLRNMNVFKQYFVFINIDHNYELKCNSQNFAWKRLIVKLKLNCCDLQNAKQMAVY